MSDRKNIEQSTSSENRIDSTSAILLCDANIDLKNFKKALPQSDNLKLLEPIDFSVPLDESRSKAPSEFIRLSPRSNKTGVEGVYESAVDVLRGVFGTRDTLHDHARLLARSGMTAAEREQLAREEKQLMAYNKRPESWNLKLLSDAGSGGFDGPLKTPMLDELNRRTVALEQSISETAKKGMTPLQIAQLEMGTASTARKNQYENRLVTIIAEYDYRGALPPEVNKAVVAAAREERLREERAASNKGGDRGVGCWSLPGLELEEKLGKTIISAKPNGGLKQSDIWFVKP